MGNIGLTQARYWQDRDKSVSLRRKIGAGATRTSNAIRKIDGSDRRLPYVKRR